MSRKRRGGAAPAFEAPEDPADYEHLRNALPGSPIPGIKPDVVGGYRFNDMAREDSVVLGHPEVAGQFKTNYDRRDKYLGTLDDAPMERTDLNYEGPEEIRKRSKGNSW